jgi:hypothetical protein
VCAKVREQTKISTVNKAHRILSGLQTFSCLLTSTWHFLHLNDGFSSETDLFFLHDVLLMIDDLV